MSTDGRSALDGPGARQGEHTLRAQGDHQGHQGGGGNGGGGGRKKRRRQRAQRGKRRGGGGPGQTSSSSHGESANRERIYQDIEGLLRQIRELAEETGAFNENQLVDFTQSVTTLSKLLETEGPKVSDRVFSEYQRVRDRLNQALRNHPMSSSLGSPN